MDFEDKKRDASLVLPYGRINVLLPIPISQYYEYLNKDLLLRIGDLVEVPFGKRFPKKQRPEKNQNIATLILPISSYVNPTPPNVA